MSPMLDSARDLAGATLGKLKHAQSLWADMQAVVEAN